MHDGGVDSRSVAEQWRRLDRTERGPDPVTLNDSGTAEYTAEWTAEANADGNCEFVLTVSNPGEQVIHSVPVSGCESSMAMTLVDGAGELDTGEYRVELKRDGERAEAKFTLEK